ncbi:MAG: hypothetical protein ACOYBR_03800 [Fluviibacter sp.]
MNRKIKQLINKHTYHKGIEIGRELRAELINRAVTMEKEGRTEAFIIQALGLPIAEHDLIAQEAAK